MGACIALGCSAAMAQTATAPTAPSATTGRSPNGAAPPPETTTETGSHASISKQATQDFVDEAARANDAEIAEARYAIAHTKSEHVKTFAERMIQDHTMAGMQLQQIASQHGYVVPTGVRLKDRASMTHLEHEHGGSFNAAYSRDEVKDHKQVIAMFEKAEQNPRIAPDIRMFARMTLPVLRQHLQMANELVASEAKGNRSAG
jgi:putative membrane protein